MILVVGCNEEKKLTKLEPIIKHDYSVTQAALDFCTRESHDLKTKLKFVFVIDKSGSNQPYQDEFLVDHAGTDPLGTRRYDPIINFLQDPAVTNISDTNIYFSLINFSTDVSAVDFDPAHTTNYFTNDRAIFEQVVRYEKAGGHYPDTLGAGVPNDAGWTNYNKAFGGTSGVKNVIYNDILREKLLNGENIVPSYYIVFFITDGAPITGQDINADWIYQSDTDVYSGIDGIRSLMSDHSEWVDNIEINTGYYFDTEDLIASNLLNMMSIRGSGSFSKFTSAIDFSDYRQPDRNVKIGLRDIFVLNMSALWVDGKLVADTDGDGLSDTLEMRLRSNINIKDSDGNNVSDAVEYQYSGSPCGNITCLAAGKRSYNNPSQCGSITDRAKDKDDDGLTDCEEQLIGTEPDSFDSNNDYIPDDIAFRNKLAAAQGSISESLENMDLDSLTNYDEIKYNTPYNFHNDDIINLKTLEYRLKTVSDSSLKTCYHLDIGNFAEVTNTSLMRIYIMEETLLSYNKKFLRTAEKAVPQGATVHFTSADFVE